MGNDVKKTTAADEKEFILASLPADQREKGLAIFFGLIQLLYPWLPAYYRDKRCFIHLIRYTLNEICCFVVVF
uniref:Uncharacterized protein n=1 Tax=Helianthus annuus TaxID=4232 RepID=A0A251SHX9_HELAN